VNLFAFPFLVFLENTNMMRPKALSFLFLSILCPGFLLSDVSQKKALLGKRPETESNHDTTTIRSDFPGGNIIVDRIEKNDVYLRQDQRDTKRWWFYWYFEACAPAGSRRTFHFTDGNVMTSRGPACSIDDGISWHWLGKEAVVGDSFTFTFPERKSGREKSSVRFCLAMPYQLSHLRDLLHRYRQHPAIHTEVHALDDTPTVALRMHLGQQNESLCRHRVLLTCRHHSCEMMASWVLEGFIEAVLSESDDGQWLRKNVGFLILPMMDPRGVENGDQGKGRHPHDHNRDYIDSPLYPTVGALKSYFPKWSNGKTRVAIDLHCPYIRGGNNETIFFVLGPLEEQTKELTHFSKLLEQVATGPRPYRAANNYPWGQGWNSGEMRTSFRSWAEKQEGMRMATTLEFPYADAEGVKVDIPAAKAFGNDLARALRCYLEPLAVPRRAVSR
jgi:hypothetical protein